MSGLILDGQEWGLDIGADEPVLLGVCIYLCMSAFIDCFCQSEIVVRLLPFLLGPIICWLPSNGLRIVVFGSGAVYRDFGVCRGRSGLGPLGTNGQLRTIPQRIFFSFCVFVSVLFFTVCIFIVVVPIHHITQVFISSLI